mmetsp:Transcript_9665/g.24766  ORF Transcript_9665/g.24766 Transcript_9665/m.24766 type:complete len:349 (-) Transcript_9665:724-1770(-)
MSMAMHFGYSFIHLLLDKRNQRRANCAGNGELLCDVRCCLRDPFRFQHDEFLEVFPHFELHVLLLTLLHKHGEVRQVPHRLAIEGVHPQICKGVWFVARRCLGCQDLREDDDLLVLVLSLGVHRVQELDGAVPLEVFPEFTPEVQHGHGSEDQPAHDEVRRLVHVHSERHWRRHGAQGDGDLPDGTLPEHSEPRLLTHELLGDEVAKGDALPPPEGHRPVARDLRALEREQDIAGEEHAVGARRGLNCPYHDTLLALAHEVGPAQGRALHPLEVNAHHWEAGERLLLGVLGEKVGDDGRGDDPADVLGSVRLERLEGNPNTEACPVEDWPATVPAVDGRVDLDPEQLA